LKRINRKKKKKDARFIEIMLCLIVFWFLGFGFWEVLRE
jgi:hypothetical protein